MMQESLFDTPKRQPQQIDLKAGLERKETGQIKAVESNARLVVEARDLAVDIARRKGTVCLDCVMIALVERGYGWHCLGNSAGRLLSGEKRLIHTGRTTRSKRVWANGNRIGVYVSKEAK